jgi:hypothetical protein
MARELSQAPLELDRKVGGYHGCSYDRGRSDQRDLIPPHSSSLRFGEIKTDQYGG